MMLDDFIWSFGIAGIVLLIFQLGLLALAIWLAFRFIAAQESMADSLRMIARELYRDNQRSGQGPA